MNIKYHMVDIAIAFAIIGAFVFIVLTYEDTENKINKQDFSEFYTYDGIRCIYKTTYKAGGLSCDWSK